MQHFLLISHGLDVLPLLYAVSNHPHLWDQDLLRTTYPGTPHTAVSDILLYFQPQGVLHEKDGTIQDTVHECLPRPAWWALPEARPLVFGLMARLQGTRLGRVMITKLPAGKQIPAHTDHPVQTAYYRRHHITLCSPEQCQFVIEDEVLALAPGSCWWVNNGAEHMVANDGPTERISLIVDIHCPPMERLYDTASPTPRPRTPSPQRRQ